jgi:hypothetical protein
MANAAYPNYRNILLGGGNHGPVDLDGDTIKGYLIDTADEAYNSADQDIADITGAGIVSTATLSGLSVASQAFTSTAITFASVTGDVSEAVILWKDSGVAATSALIAFYDTFASGMPVTPNGGNIQVSPHASGWITV